MVSFFLILQTLLDSTISKYERLQERLIEAESEEEVNRILEEALHSPKVLDRCAELHDDMAEYDDKIKAGTASDTDLEIHEKVALEFEYLSCMGTIDEWQR